MLLRRVIMMMLLSSFFSPATAQDAQDVALTLQDGSTLRYALVLPRHFDAYREYPVLLALPPGPQDRDMVDTGLSRYWGRQAAARDWIVVSPVAPRGRLFFKGSEDVIPELLDLLQKQYQVEGGKFHLAGVSNGGLSAFRIAINWPERFHSLTALPGFPPTDRDFQRLDRLEGLPIHMFAGSQDKQWVEEETRAHEKLTELEIPSTLEIFPDEGHVPASMDGEAVMDLLETLRPVPEEPETAGATGEK
jgi:pimeloyl-ACP methyl ester carboxylesterase